MLSFFFVLRSSISYGWVGLSDIDQEGLFLWINNAPLNYPDRWSIGGSWGQPNGGTGQNCVVLDMQQDDGNFQDKTCSEDNNFICSSLGKISDLSYPS